MKALNKILGIGLIALIAMVGIGAVSASADDTTSIEFGDDGFNWVPLYSDDSGVNYRDEINQSCGGITVDDWNVDTRDGFGQYEYHFYKNGLGWGPDSDDPELNWNSETNTGFLGSTFTGNQADANGGAIYYTNGMTGSLSDGNGNLLTRDVSGFVVPGSSIEPPRPDINIPYYPTDVTEI